MAIDFESNNATFFYNTNVCRSFVKSLSTVLVPLSSQPCSEVLLINKTGDSIFVYDNSYITDQNRLLLDINESITIRGLTNSSQISAKGVLSGGDLYYRTQMFSLNTQG